MNNAVCLLVALLLFQTAAAQLQRSWNTTTSAFTYQTLSLELSGRTIISDATDGDLAGCSLLLSLTGTNCPASLSIATNCSKQGSSTSRISAFILSPALGVSNPIPDDAVCAVASLRLESTGTSVNSFEIANPLGSTATVINQAPTISDIQKISTPLVGSGSNRINITGNGIFPSGPWLSFLRLRPLHQQSSCTGTVSSTVESVAPGILRIFFSVTGNIDACYIYVDEIRRAGVPASKSTAASAWDIQLTMKALPVANQRSPPVVLSHTSGVSLNIVGSNLPLDATELSNVTLIAASASCQGSTACVLTSFGNSSITCLSDLSLLSLSQGRCSLNATISRFGVTSGPFSIGFDVEQLNTSSGSSVATIGLSSDNIAAGIALGVILAFGITMVAFYVAVRLDSIKFKKMIAAARAARAAKLAASGAVHMRRTSDSHSQKTASPSPIKAASEEHLLPKRKDKSRA
jgi:hypothetical protein